MSITAILIIGYLIILFVVYARILYETRSTSKTLSYLLFCTFIPVGGIIFYLAFGINYWKKKHYNKKSKQDEAILNRFKKDIVTFDTTPAHTTDKCLLQHTELIAILNKDLGSPLTRHNKVKLLINGEQKFPEILRAMKEAKHHIHLEYYIYEYDEIGTQIIELLIEKAMEGVQVRFIYDDFGSPTIKRKTEKRMRNAGIEIYPYNKVVFYLLANRINYRNHRKILVIDGHTGFVGGINVCDKYINNQKNDLYWRDTHIMINGPGIYYLQYLFIADWKFCSSYSIEPLQEYFCTDKGIAEEAGTYVQIAAGGPDAEMPTLLYSILQAIYLAEKEILITTPYFIPGDSIIDALSVAALSGLSVKLLVPGISDSRVVNAASKSSYASLLKAGVEIYLYQKGFVHAKTIVTDNLLSVVGTANMDHRSFDLNFEVNAIIYDETVAAQIRTQFFKDLDDAEKIDKDAWLSRPGYIQFPEKIARLFSPVL